MTHSVLIVDDEETFAKNVKRYLDRHEYESRIANTGKEAIEALDSFKPDTILLDLNLPDGTGLDFLSQIKQIDNQARVVFMTGSISVDSAVKAMKAGAEDYLTKPLVLSELKLLLDKLVRRERKDRALAYYQNKEAQQGGLSALLGTSESLTKIKSRIQQFIASEQNLSDTTPPPVLVTGETGTGKDLIARAFHFDGPRRDKPFVEINCASIPSQLMEAELFGFERGTFTDAKQRKLGLVESANGGTLFLDEIGDMDVALQAKLLTLLEHKRVRRLGGLRDQSVDVRIVAATNQDLQKLIEENRFRSDLLYRLHVLHINLPPLREHPDDIKELAEHFLNLHAKRYNKPGLSFSSAAVDALVDYDWPGNIRELRNLIEHAVLLTEAATIKREHLAIKKVKRRNRVPASNTGTSNGVESGLSLVETEIDLVRKALKQTGGNVTQASRLLGISRDTLRYRMEKYKLTTTTLGQAG
ncbi:MAG: sigma-54 dependent transcriptional regulator [Gammaproteobacteria bacterium]|nr:sigma-54 dependent transcriptional regulator [Gammaproteobacteria bacterium]